MPCLAKLRKELAVARSRTDLIFSQFSPQALYERPISERHRVIFYLGHLEAFDWNQICRWTLGHSSFHPTFDSLFEAGIDPEVGSCQEDTPKDWPSIEEVQEYSAKVRHYVDEVIDEAPDPVIHMAIEHRWMHVETTAYLLHHANSSGKIAHPQSQIPECPSPDHFMVEIPEGSVTLGRQAQDGFGWDNEFDQHQQNVAGFAMSKYKVTNAQYLRFVNDGGPVPMFWVQRGDQWFLQTMFDEIMLPDDWPVYVSLKEARVFAQWAGLSLPTESQFHRAAYGTRFGHERAYPWGNKSPNGVHGNFNFQYWDPVPVTAYPEGDSEFGVSQLVGNSWEWTCSPFRPFEGFKPYATYPGYSKRFFDDDHFIVKGGSPTTASRLLRRSFRNWFREGYPHAHASFRCVKNF